MTEFVAIPVHSSYLQRVGKTNGVDGNVIPVVFALFHEVPFRPRYIGVTLAIHYHQVTGIRWETGRSKASGSEWAEPAVSDWTGSHLSLSVVVCRVYTGPAPRTTRSSCSVERNGKRSAWGKAHAHACRPELVPADASALQAKRHLILPGANYLNLPTSLPVDPVRVRRPRGRGPGKPAPTRCVLWAWVVAGRHESPR
jgi:hypothetical protein